MGEQALAGLNIVDLTTNFGYASKLYADLGASVVLVEPPGGSPARARPPLAAGKSLWFEYRNGGKRCVALDADAVTDRDTLRRLIASADIVFDDRPQSYWQDREMGWASLHGRNPELVWCAITGFGQTGPASGMAACDLLAMASGGMAWLTGYDDSGPYVADCGLATTSAAQYAAVMAIIALLGRRNVGGGQFIDVSMQEVMALGTETAPQFLEMKGILRRRLGEGVRQAGIGIYPCADGLVFLFTAESGVGRGWDLLVEWLEEAGVEGAAELRGAAWKENAYKAQPDQCRLFETVWKRFAATRTREWLFHEGQRRRIAISPLNGAGEVLVDPHLGARGFFHRGAPGAPYRLSATPWSAPCGPEDGAASVESILADFGRARPTAPALPKARGAPLPLAGLRVVDFTWVGAGPFTTKLLADFGAEVWKIESATRPDQLRRAEPVAKADSLDASGYFANRNTNKKSVTLDLKRPEDLARIKAMLAGADIVANSFSPGVMDRAGLAWRDVAQLNPRIVYLGMPLAGDEGPYRDYRGYGINIATLVGMFGRHALPGRRPVGTGTNFPDHLPNPLHACFAMLAALAFRQRSHRGQRIEVAQIESTLAACPDAVLEMTATGRESLPPAYDEPWRAPHGIFQCLGEDRWCALSVGDDRAFARLAALLGRPDLAASARLGDRPAVEALVRDWMRQRTAEDAVTALRGADVDAVIVANPDDLLNRDPQLAARGFWQYLAHPVMGRGVYHGVAATFSRTSNRYRSGAPLLGQHDKELAEMLNPDLAGTRA